MNTNEILKDLHLENSEKLFSKNIYEDKLFTKKEKKFFAPQKTTPSLPKKPTWEPIEFSLNNSSIPPIKLTDYKINFENFRIYVNDKDFFVLKDSFPKFSDILEINWDDEKNEYTLFLKAMYVLSYLGGMSIQNLKNENQLASSLSHFYFYYHLKKYLNYRNFSGLDFSPLEKVELFQSLYFWEKHRVHYYPHMDLSEKEFKRGKHDVIGDIKKSGKWVSYKTRGKKRNLEKDYLKLINYEGKGLTKMGQLLFQESNQAYVYCVLGSQAKTHWKIIGDGANSFQTQQVFKDLVKEVTQQNNLSILIKSMRLAIASTKVRLDFCVSPGLELLPSKMIYIKDSPGYNNILLISNKTQKFGENNVNGIEKKSKSPEKPKIQESKNKNPVGFHNVPESSHNMTPVLISGGLIAIALRFIWLAL